MKEIVPSPPAIVLNAAAAVQALFQRNVIPSYARFDLALSHGSGSYLYDVAGRRYLDLGGGIAVCCLGHAHPAVTEALLEQSRKLVHVSNLYYTEPQGRLAEALANLLGPGKLFSAKAARRRTKDCSNWRASSATMKAAMKSSPPSIRFTAGLSQAWPPQVRRKSRKASSRKCQAFVTPGS